MYNWSVDIRQLKKNKQQFAKWRLEQLVNFGLNGEKIRARDLKKYWANLRLDPEKKTYLSWLLWGRRS
ncbi:MAG: hypothetical protein WC862_03760 [Patescibacteria group bacterium]